MKPTFNLASRTYLNRRSLYGFYGVVIAVSLGVLVLNGLYGYRLYLQSRQATEKLSALDQELGELRGVTAGEVGRDKYQLLEERIDFANSILSKDSFRWTDLLNRLEEVAIDGISIQSIQPEYKEGNLRLAGTARGVEELRKFLDRVIESPYFSYVYLNDQARVQVHDSLGRERQAVSFSLLVKGAF